MTAAPRLAIIAPRRPATCTAWRGIRALQAARMRPAATGLPGAASAAPGPFQAHGSGPSDSAIYRWEGSGPWQVIEGPLDSHVYALATGQGQLFAGLGDGTLLQSQDGGESWSELGERIGGITALAVK